MDQIGQGRGRARNFLRPSTEQPPPENVPPSSQPPGASQPSGSQPPPLPPGQSSRIQPLGNRFLGSGPSGSQPPGNRFLGSGPSESQPALGSHLYGSEPSRGIEPERPEAIQSIIGFSQRGTNKPVIKSTGPPSGPFTSGSNDRSVELVANFVKVRANHKIIIYQYHVDFSTKVVNPETRNHMINTNAEALRNAYIYDKQNTVMSTTKLPRQPYTYNHVWNGKPVKVSFRLVREITIDDEQMMHFFNAQLRMNFERLDQVQILKNFYDFTGKVHIPEHKLEVMPGIVATIKNCQDGILMGLDTIHKVVHLKTVLDVINEMLANNRTNLERELVGLIVLTRYNNRTYRICGVDRTRTPQSEFDRTAGENINFMEYYRQNYNITIQDQNQPLLQATSSNFEKKQKSRKLYLIPELCYITGLTPSMMTNFNLKRLIIERTQVSPRDRVRRYNDFLQKINANTRVQEELEKWQISYGTELLQIKGTRLAPEKVITQDAPFNFDQVNADFTRELKGKRMFKSCALVNWHVICIEREIRHVESFLNQARDLARNYGIRFENPNILTSIADNSRSYLQTIGRISSSDLVLVVLPTPNKTMYDDIKKHLCCEVGFPSQCVLLKTLFKKNMSISNKIMIQMAVKVGAEPWVLDFDKMPKGLMVVGFDVFRDKTKRKRSVGGFVASLNATFSQWFSMINFHTKLEETSDHFAISMGAALRAYYKKNGVYPGGILVIRDGVSEGQYKFTIETELAQLKQRVNQTAGDCKITFLCINKRINTRFFEREEGILGNPVSGTIVDNTIVNANIPQFLLVSQATTQGTVSPTSYDILQDNLHWPIVEYQRLVYKLCHLYYNWTGLISVPAPCQYAHKLAYLAGGSFEKPFVETLSEKLFFL